MKKLAILLLLLFLASLTCYATEKRIIPVYYHIPIVDKYITHHNTETIKVKVMDMDEFIDTTTTVSNETWTYTIKKVKKVK